MTGGQTNERRLWRGPLLAWIALLLLFLISLGSAYLRLGAGNVVLNLVIAAVMVAVLAVFLMDLRNSRNPVPAIAVGGLFWTIIMLSLTFSDYFTRH